MSPILALQGAPRPAIQLALAAFGDRRRAEGWRVAGLVETTSAPGGAGCAGHALSDLGSGARYPIAQNLGRLSDACHLDGGGVAQACQSVLDALSEGCDVLILAKFGKLEAARGGLVDAFGQAIARDIPILTSVAPGLAAGWAAFTGELARVAPPDTALIEEWWHAVRPREEPATRRD